MLVLKPSLPDSEIISNVRRSREKSVFPVLELYGPQYRKLTALFCQILYFLIYENRNNLKTLVSCIIVWIDIQLNIRFLTVYRPKINKQNQLKNNLKIIDFFYLWNSKTCFQQFAWQLFFFIFVILNWDCFLVLYITKRTYNYFPIQFQNVLFSFPLEIISLLEFVF